MIELADVSQFNSGLQIYIFFNGDLKMEIFGGDYLFWEVLKFKS